MAWQRHKRELCSGCGQPRSASMAKENQFAYAAEVVRCQACKAQGHASEAYQKNEDNDQHGIMVRLTKTP